MYNYSIKTTYLDLDDDKQDTQYRKELLDVFGVTEYSHETFMNSIDSMFQKMEDNKQLATILDEVIKNFCFPFKLDQTAAFTMMFSFESFHYFHKCLKELERNNVISDETFDEIIKNLQKK